MIVFVDVKFKNVLVLFDVNDDVDVDVYVDEVEILLVYVDDHVHCRH